MKVHFTRQQYEALVDKIRKGGFDDENIAVGFGLLADAFSDPKIVSIAVDSDTMTFNCKEFSNEN